MTRQSSFDRVVHLKKRGQSLRIGLLSRLNEYASDFPSGTPKDIIRVIKDVLVAAEEQINSATDPKLLQLMCMSLQRLGALLAFFDNAHTAQTPRGLSELLEQLMQKLQPGCPSMVWPEAGFNYSIRNLLPTLQPLTQALLSTAEYQKIYKGFTGRLNLVSFPRIERDNLLLHAIFGHELGHPIAEKFLASERTTKKYNDELFRVVKKLNPKGSRKGTSAPSSDLAHALNRLLKLRHRGLQELISDCVGVLLFGYSAVFASYDMFVAGGLDLRPDDTSMYPPRRLRLRLASRIAAKTGHTTALKSLKTQNVDSRLVRSTLNFIDHLDQLVTSTEDGTALKTDRVIEIAYDWIESTLDDAIAFAMKEIGVHAYDAKKIKREIPELIERIDLSLPPSEIGRPPRAAIVDWRSSILAAWLYRLHGQKLTGPNKGRPLDNEDLSKLNRLTLKAVEDASLRQKYNSYREQQRISS